MISNGQFCYWDCKSVVDGMVLLTNSLISIIIAMYAIKYCCKFYKIYKLEIQSSKQIYRKFIGIIISGFVYALNFVFSIIVFLLIFINKQDKQVGYHITTYSRIYSFVQSIPSMILQTLLFSTAQTLITNSMGVLIQNHKQPSRRQRIKYKFIKIYRLVRYLFLLYWILILIPFPSIVTSEIIAQIKILLLTIDCLIILILLRFCHVYLLTNSQVLLPARQREQAKLARDTKLLFMTAVVRVFMLLVFYIVFPLIFLSSGEKPCLEGAAEHLEYTIGYLFVGTLVMNFLPMIIVMKIYHPGKNRVSLQQSSSIIAALN